MTSHMKLIKPILLSAFPALAVLGSTQAAAVPVTLTIENLSQNEGLFLTPVWTAFHDGSFDLYNSGEAVGSGGLPAGLESLAEDGDTAALSGDFAGSSAAARGGFDATNPGANGVPGPVDPGEVLTAVFDLDSDLNRFFSYASMVIPSNDAFIANGDPMAFALFDSDGNFTSLSFDVFGENVLDAGTESNTETSAAFLNQTAANQGESDPAEDGVQAHPGFNGSLANPDGSPVNILGGTNAAGLDIDSFAADFTRAGYELARFSFSIDDDDGGNGGAEEVPAPASLALLFAGLAGMIWTRRRSLKA